MLEVGVVYERSLVCLWRVCGCTVGKRRENCIVSGLCLGHLQ